MRALSRLLFAVTVASACGPSGANPGGDDEPPLEERTCISPEADRANTADLEDALGTARVTVGKVEECQRTYTLASTAVLRDNLPANGERVVYEHADAPTLRTGHDLFDALYALAQDEVRENSVDSIHDFAFGNGQPLACPPGGCFETGRLWTYVWTRDTSYSVDLGLAGLDPVRARNSLEFKLSARRAGGPEQIVQDTGTGGSYPVSTDRTTWSLGAAALLPHLDGADREAFRDRALAAIAATIEHDRAVIFDGTDGLYLGEQSFLDWREQSYPSWTAGDVAPIATSKALSTNLVHLRAIELAAELAGETGDSTLAARYQGWATELRDAIRAKFWLEDAGLFATFTTTFLDPAPARQFDLLGNALAVLSGVASPAQADAVLASYPHFGAGAAPVIFPQQQLTAIYHNRAEWPFVTAYWLRAAAAADHPAVADRALRSLMRGAALNLSNMENFEIVSGAPFFEDGMYSGPVVNSHRQLWSVAGYVSMVHHTLFGLRFDSEGLTVSPYVTRDLRNSMFAGTNELVLNDVPWRGAELSVVLHLPPAGDVGGSYVVEEVRLNGQVVDGPITRDQLDPTNRIDVQLAAPSDPATPPIELRDAADWRQIFAPRVPSITAVRRAGAGIALDLSAGGEDASTIRYNIYRDGIRVASDLTAASYTDASADPAGAPCYAVETCFTQTGNCSQRSRPMCWWGDNNARIQAFGANQFQATGGTPSNAHGRFHYEAWGDAGHQLVLPSVQPTTTGLHLIQLVYGNGAGPINTGITAVSKRIVVEDTATNQQVASGIVTMPHLGEWGRWADSTFVRANLQAGKTYRIRIVGDELTVNMSAFAHFASYVSTGGMAGEFARVNISELKLLAR